MRKTIAAVSASILGLSGAVVASTAPAAAAVPKCTTESDVTVSANANTQPFYIDCIPQYGLGKAEFTLTSTTLLPSGYSLADGKQTVTSTVDSSAANAYFGVTPPPPSSFLGGWLHLGNPGSGSPTEQVYDSPFLYLAYPITSVEQLTTGNVPPSCTPDGEIYAHVYQINFAPSNTTFKQTIAGKVYTVTTTATMPHLTLALNFADSPGTGFDTTKPQCATGPGGTVLAENSSDSNWNTVTENEATFNADNGISLDPAENTDFVLDDAAVSVTSATPTLPTTGVDPAPAGLLGLGLLVIGGLVGAAGAVRRRARAN